MGDRRIVDLTAETSFASGDVLAVDNANNTETKKITAANAITTPINNVSQKVSGSSDAYSSSKAYSVGDMVIYNNIVYKCTTACSAASWSVNQNNFTATTLAESVTALNNDLNSYTELADLDNTIPSVNSYINLSDDFTNYKFIVIFYRWGSTGYAYHAVFYVPLLIGALALGPSITNVNAWTGLLFSLSTPKKILVSAHGSQSGVYISKIVGVKV